MITSNAFQYTLVQDGKGKSLTRAAFVSTLLQIFSDCVVRRSGIEFEIASGPVFVRSKHGPITVGCRTEEGEASVNVSTISMDLIWVIEVCQDGSRTFTITAADGMTVVKLQAGSSIPLLQEEDEDAPYRSVKVGAVKHPMKKTIINDVAAGYVQKSFRGPNDG